MNSDIKKHIPISTLFVIILLYLTFPTVCFDNPALSDPLQHIIYAPTYTFSGAIGKTTIFTHRIFKCLIYCIDIASKKLSTTDTHTYFFQIFMILFVFLTGISFANFIRHFQNIGKNIIMQTLLPAALLLSSGYLFIGSFMDCHIAVNLLHMLLIMQAVKYFYCQNKPALILLICLILLACSIHVISMIISANIIFSILLFKRHKLKTIIKPKHLAIAAAILAPIVFALYFAVVYYFRGFSLNPFNSLPQISSYFQSFKNMIVFYDQTDSGFLSYIENLLYLLIALHLIFSFNKMPSLSKFILSIAVPSWLAIFFVLSNCFPFYGLLTHYIFLVIPFFAIIAVSAETLLSQIKKNHSKPMHIFFITAVLFVGGHNINKVLIPRAKMENNIAYHFLTELNGNNITNAAIFADNVWQYDPEEMSYFAKDYLKKNIRHFSTKSSKKEIKAFFNTYKDSNVIISATDKKDLIEKQHLYATLIDKKIVLIHQKKFSAPYEDFYYFDIQEKS